MAFFSDPLCVDLIGDPFLLTPTLLRNIKHKCGAVDRIPGVETMHNRAQSVMVTCEGVSPAAAWRPNQTFF